MGKFKALLTDLDGTLIHSQESICRALQASFQDLGVSVPKIKEIMDMFGLPVEHMLITLTEVKLEDEKRIQEFLTYYKTYYKIFMKDAELICNAKETVAYACEKGFPVCLITSERRQNAEFILQNLNLDGYIKYIVSRDDVIKFKPDKEPIEKGVAEVGFLPEECIYIGESPFDLQAGLSAGVYVVAVPSGSWSRESLFACKPSAFIEDIKELQQIMDQ